MGSPIVEFADFMKSQGSAWITSAEKLLNEAAKRSYLLDKFVNGGFGLNIQAGSTIKDAVMFDDASTFSVGHVDDPIQYQNPQVMTEIESYWRLGRDHMTWNEVTIALNIGTDMTAKGRAQRYKNLKRVLEQRMWTSYFNGMDALLFSAPQNQQAAMEDPRGTLPFSLFAFVTENATYKPTGWTTIQTVNPTNESKWRNQMRTYNAADPLDATATGDGLFDAFHRMYQDCKWETPKLPHAGETFEKDQTGKRTQFVGTSRVGDEMYGRLLRHSNSDLVRKQDAAYHGNTYGDLEVKPYQQFDDAAIYDNGGSFVTEANATKAGPRFYWLNSAYLKLVMHAEFYAKMKAPRSLENSQLQWVQPVFSLYNMFCHSRQRLGIVTPQ